MTQPPAPVHTARKRLTRPVVATIGLALLATGTGGCMGSDQKKVGGGPQGHPTASPARLTPAGSPAPKPASKPNIITILTDDMRTDDLRWMPNVRRLVADQGLEFTNSFSSYPLCAPARASLVTGQYSHNTGVVSVKPPNSFHALDDRRTVATAMNHAGYNTMFLGKYLNGYGTQRSAVTGKNSFRYVPPGWTDWWGSVDRPPHSGFAGGGTYRYYHLLLNHNGTIDDTHKGVYQTVAEGRIARRLVRTYHRSAKPFFFLMAPIAPHFGSPREPGDPAPQTWPGTGAEERFKTVARPKRVRGLFDRQISRASGLPADGSESQKNTDGLPRPMRWLPPIVSREKTAMLSVTRQRAESLFVLDQQIGKLVDTLKKTGEYDHTVLMFTSDNGYFLGEHRMRQGKIKAHEPSLRVPLVVAGHGIPHGTRYDPVTTEDLTATILDLAHARPPHPEDGASMVPSISRDRGWRSPVLTEGLETSRVFRTARSDPAPGFDDPRTTIGIRTPGWKYIRYVDGDGELFDLDKDPNELSSHFGDPAYARVQAELQQLWLARKDCRGASCSAPMPKDLQRGPHENRLRTDAQSRGVEARYGYYR